MKRNASTLTVTKYSPKGKPRSRAVVKKAKFATIPYMVRMGSQAFPKRLYNTLKYASTTTKTLTSGVTSIHQFTCNGLYDPDISGSGHQPMYYDQLMAIYNHYTVLRSRFRVTPMITGGVTDPVMLTVFVNDGGSATNTSTQPFNLERQGAKFMQYNPGVGFAPSYLPLSWSGKQSFGGDLLDNDDLQGTVGANPVEQQYFNIDTFCPFLLSSTAGVILLVQIEYDVCWEERTTISSS